MIADQKIGFLEASVAYGLKREELCEEFLSYLQSTIAKIVRFIYG